MIRELLPAGAAILLLVTQAAVAENTNFLTSHFSGSGNCAMCHDRLTDTSGEDVSIVKDWGASMMANSSKDPFWRAKVATELERNPQLSGVISDTCTKCHAPMANYEVTKVQGGQMTLFGADGVLNPNHSLYDAAMNGVSCTLCHQIADDASLGTLNGFSGQYSFSGSRAIYGKYSNIFGQPMVNNTGYRPTYSAHVSDSDLCATCHNLKTPFVDANGNVLTTSPEAEFPEQMPYTEWQHSIFDDAGSNPQSCQDCHLPKTTAKLSNRPPWLGVKEGFPKHHLVGANTVMLTLLRDNAAQLDVISPNLDLSIARARDMLQSAVNLAIVSASLSKGVLEARVRVENNSGHKTPTAYPSRRMWLHFKVTDANDNIVFESGRINPDGSIAGADNDSDQGVFEPHYGLITAPDQVQIYEAIMGDSDGNPTYTLLRAARYLKDNRLTPKGFDKLQVPSDVAVRGQAADDADFNLGSDEVIYRIPVVASGDLNVEVSLNYQTIAHGYLQDLYRDDHLQQVQDFRAMYEAQSLKHERIAGVQKTLVNGAGSSAGVGSGATDNGTVTESASDSVSAPTVTLTASPSRVWRGNAITVSWSSTDAKSCAASGDWAGAKATAGSESLVINDSVTFVLSCSGEGGSVSASVSYQAFGRRWLFLS